MHFLFKHQLLLFLTISFVFSHFFLNVNPKPITPPLPLKVNLTLSVTRSIFRRPLIWFHQQHLTNKQVQVSRRDSIEKNVQTQSLDYGILLERYCQSVRYNISPFHIAHVPWYQVFVVTAALMSKRAN